MTYFHPLFWGLVSVSIVLTDIKKILSLFQFSSLRSSFCKPRGKSLKMITVWVRFPSSFLRFSFCKIEKPLTYWPLIPKFQSSFLRTHFCKLIIGNQLVVELLQHSHPLFWGLISVRSGTISSNASQINPFPSSFLRSSFCKFSVFYFWNWCFN